MKERAFYFSAFFFAFFTGRAASLCNESCKRKHVKANRRHFTVERDSRADQHPNFARIDPPYNEESEMEMSVWFHFIMANIHHKQQEGDRVLEGVQRIIMGLHQAGVLKESINRS